VTPPSQDVVRAAARNNAEWCALMSRTHGVTGVFEDGAWVAAARTPTYYPDAVTLRPGVAADALSRRIDTGVPGASVKDSFADLDLSGSGFDVLFEAHWIHRPTAGPLTGPRARPDIGWEVVAGADALRDWATAWDHGQGHRDLFRAELLDDADTLVVAGRGADGHVVAGAVASRGAGVVGVSNLFTRDGDLDTAWSLALSALHSSFPGQRVVGYQRGEGLRAALRHGFETVGPLRVWIQRGMD
jgi:hypothetical protein